MANAKSKKSDKPKTGKRRPSAARQGRPRLMTDAQVAKAVELAGKGKTVAEMAEMATFQKRDGTPLSPATIAKAIRDQLGVRARGRKAPDDDVQKEIVKQYKAGWSAKTIREDVLKNAVSLPTIYKVLHDHGVEIRSVGDYAFVEE